MWLEKSLKFAKARFLGNCPIWVETWIFKTRLNLQVKPIRCNFRRNTIIATPRNASSKSFFEFYEFFHYFYVSRVIPGMHRQPRTSFGQVHPCFSVLEAKTNFFWMIFFLILHTGSLSLNANLYNTVLQQKFNFRFYGVYPV